MKTTTSARKHFGILPLSPDFVRGIQLEWDMVEAPSPRPRFLDFPLRDQEQPKPAPARRHARNEKRALAA